MTRADRRVNPRVALNTEAVIEHADTKVRCRALNIATRGLALLCKSEVLVGQRVRVHFFLPNGAGWLCTNATLVREEPHTSGRLLGLKFQFTDDQTTMLIERYVAEQLGIPPPGPGKREVVGPKPAPLNAAKEQRQVKNLFQAAVQEVKGGKSGKR